MNVPFELSAFVDRLASDAGLKLSLALVHFLWQGVLIAAAAAVLMRLVGRRSPQRRYAIGVVALGLMAVAPIVTFCLVEPIDWSKFVVEEESAFDFASLESSELELLLATFETGGDLSAVAAPAAPARPLTWPERVQLVQPYALLVWLCGTGVCALRLGIGLQATWRFGRKRRSLPEEWRDIATRIATSMGVPSPRIFVSDRIVEAVAVGLLKPMVLLPAAWIGNVPVDVLEAVLAHELAHLRRHDLWVNLLQRVVEAVLFYHPAVWWLSRRIRIEREYCCDEIAATVVSGRAAYARALEFVAKERVASTQRPTWTAALAAGMGGSNMALLNRVRRVLGSDIKPSRGTWLSEGLLALAVPLALWAGIVTVTPAVATADDADKAQQSDKEPVPDDHIGDIYYWKSRGIEPGMITVLKDGQLFDLATGEVVGSDVVIDRSGDVGISSPLPRHFDPNLPDAEPSERPMWNRDDDTANVLRELREEMRRLRRELDDVRKGSFQKQRDEAPETHTDSPKIKEALERRISIQLKDVPLRDAIAEFREKADVNFVIEHAGLDEEGVNADSPVSLDLQDVSLRQALFTLLSPLNLGFMADNDVITITSRLRTQGPLTVQTYPVATFVVSLPVTFGRGPELETGLAGRGPAFERLIDLITGTIEPGSWETVGGQGVIRANDSTLSLIVRQTQTVHEQIADLLDHLRRLQEEKAERERQERIGQLEIDRKRAAAMARPINRTHKAPSRSASGPSQKTQPDLPKNPPDEPSEPSWPSVPESTNVETADRLLRVVPLEIDGKQIEVIVEEFREGQGPAKEIQLRVLRPAEKVELESEIRQAMQDREASWDSEVAATEAQKARDRLRETQRRLAPGHPHIQQAQERLRAAEENAERQQIIAEMRKEHPDFPPDILQREVDAVIEARSAAAAASVKAREAKPAQQHAEELQRKVEEQARKIEELQKQLEGKAKELERQGAALKPLVDEYNAKLNARDFAAAIEIAKRAKEVAPDQPEVIPMLFKAKVLLFEAQQHETTKESEEDAAPVTVPEPSDDAATPESDETSSFRVLIPALSLASANEASRDFTFWLGFAR